MTDRQNDRIVAGAIGTKERVPILMAHGHTDPTRAVGVGQLKEHGSYGARLTGRLAVDDEDSEILREHARLAWAQAKQGIVDKL